MLKKIKKLCHLKELPYLCTRKEKIKSTNNKNIIN